MDPLLSGAHNWTSIGAMFLFFVRSFYSFFETAAREAGPQAEATTNPIFLVFLDWEKAFDRIKQNKLIEALTRMDLPTKYIQAIQSIYNNPSFSVKMGNSQSTWRKQRRGIRQGCPLSPYLFIILMTAMLLDVHAEVSKKTKLISKG